MRALRGGVWLGLAVLAAATANGLGDRSHALASRADDDFEITGEVDGLYPGIETTLDSRVTNHQRFTIQVTAVDVTVGDARDGCPGSLLEVVGPDTIVDIPPGRTGTVPLTVRMSRRAPDPCQGAVWPLVFVATAVGSGDELPPGVSRPLPIPPLPGPDEFAFTGINVLRLAVIASALVALGVTLRRAAARRRSSAGHHS
jgi:hypothetical protein